MTFEDEVVFVGDVHGYSNLLSSALEDAVAGARLVVGLGDYVNLGPDTRQVLEVLCEAKRHLGERLVLLRGNHDQSLLRYLADSAATDFLRIGGLATIRAYHPDPPPDVLDAFRRAFPVHHLELLRSTTSHLENADFLASHCGYNPRKPGSRALDDMVLGSFGGLFSTDRSDQPRPLVVCGHYVQRTGRPYLSPSLICADTGVGHTAGAPLTTVSLPSRRVRQYGQ